MAFAPHLCFRAAAPLLVAAVLLAGTRAQADAAKPFPASGNVRQTLLAQSMASEPEACESDRTKLRPPDRLEPHALPSQRARPVILDAVMYFDAKPHSGTSGGRKAAVSLCSVHPHMTEFGVMHRQIDSTHYY